FSSVATLRNRQTGLHADRRAIWRIPERALRVDGYRTFLHFGRWSHGTEVGCHRSLQQMATAVCIHGYDADSHRAILQLQENRYEEMAAQPFVVVRCLCCADGDICARAEFPLD